MSDTPETDSLARGNHVVPTEFAQELERDIYNLQDQRDFAMDEMKRLERERDHWKSESLEQAKLLAMSADREEKIVRERDEAREAFAIATSKCVDAQQRLREMEDQRDFAMSEMERLKR
jgi:hypothetical protein